MAHPPEVASKEKAWLVLAILAGEMTVTEAALKAKASERSVSNWKRRFVESGRQGLAEGGKPVPSDRAAVGARHNGPRSRRSSVVRPLDALTEQAAETTESLPRGDVIAVSCAKLAGVFRADVPLPGGDCLQAYATSIDRLEQVAAELYAAATDRPAGSVTCLLVMVDAATAVHG